MPESISERLVPLLGGRLAMDFANSGSLRRPLSWEELLVFLEASAVISPQRSAVLLELPEADPIAAHALLQRASSFRDGLRRVFLTLIRKETPKPETVEAINELLRVTEGHDELLFDVLRRVADEEAALVLDGGMRQSSQSGFVRQKTRWQTSPRIGIWPIRI